MSISPDTLAMWERLATHSGQVDPFCCTPKWQVPFHEAFTPARPLFVEASAGSLVAFAVAPLPEEAHALVPIESHWCFGCPVLGPDAIDLLLDTLRARPDITTVAISGTQPQSPQQHALVVAAGPGFRAGVRDDGIQCAASLEGGFDGFLSRRPASLRKNLRTAARRAQQAGMTFERVCPTTLPHAIDTYARMIAVEQTSWKGIGDCGMATGQVKVFYDLMLRRLALTGDGRVIFAKLGTRDVGFIFGGLAGGYYRGQQFSFDESCRHLSVGHLMQIEQLRWLCEDGATRYDMGPFSGPRMAYKAPWAELRMPLQTLVLVRR